MISIGLFMFKNANRTLVLGYGLLIACVFSLIFVNDLSEFSRGQWLVELFGESGAWWIFKSMTLAIAFGLLFMIRSEHISNRKIGRFLIQRSQIDNTQNRS